MTEAGINVMEGDDSEESSREFGDLYHVSVSKNKKPISLKIYLEGRPVTMELDTGSAVSVMSEGVYFEYLNLPHSFKGHPFEAVHLHGRVSEAHGVLPCDCAVPGTV